MALIELELDMPEDVEVRGYERIDQGHALEVDWPLPETCTCQICQRTEQTRVQYADKVHVIRDLDLWGQPSFFVYQPPFHKCSYCNHRQWLLPPFKRKHVTYTLRFEQHVLSLLIGSTAEEVGRRLGISAEMVETILRNRLSDEQVIDPERQITDVGLDEISLKKGHKLYVTLLTDLSDPERPRVLAVAKGKDKEAAIECLSRLSEQQRRQVQVARTDMSPAYRAACRKQLPNAQNVIDRFHVAKRLGKVVDRVRKKRTRKAKSNLSKAERKKFKSCMWAFRSRPETLRPEQQQELSRLFEQTPELGYVYSFRWGLTEVFDTATDREEAAKLIEDYRELLEDKDEELAEFFATYDAHQDGILAYFDQRKTSGPVEGINNKARVVTKRCYGVKSVKTLWRRLCMDLNWAADAVGRTVRQTHALIDKIRNSFLAYYT